jgi:hypothetical protein
VVLGVLGVKSLKKNRIPASSGVLEFFLKLHRLHEQQVFTQVELGIPIALHLLAGRIWSIVADS